MGFTNTFETESVVISDAEVTAGRVGSMQDRYVGDIGDYVKLAILRALSPGRRLGIAWWLFPDSGSVGDGRHISYLGAPTKWRHLDPQLYDALEQVVASGSRKITALEGLVQTKVTLSWVDEAGSGW
jgi:hypothetical protein